MRLIIPKEAIERKILFIRGKNAMLDRDLARLYNVPTRVLNQSVRRNSERFPLDFMFQLNKEEFEDWKSQFVMSKSDRMGLRRSPYAFTEHGILMLSSVLNSKKAVQVNIAIMRIFVKLREIMHLNKDLTLRLESLERAAEKQGEQIHLIFQVIEQLMDIEKKPKRKIGFYEK